MKMLLRFVIMCLLALTIVRPATAASVDETLSYWNPVTGSCTSGRSCFIGFQVLPDFDFFSGFETTGVYNIEVLDPDGNQIHLGVPRTARLFADRWRLTGAVIPSSVTARFPWGTPVWLEVWVYVSGPRFETPDVRQFWVQLNPPPPEPCEGGYCEPKG